LKQLKNFAEKKTGDKPDLNAFRVLHRGFSFNGTEGAKRVHDAQKYYLPRNEHSANLSNVRYFPYQNEAEKQDIFIIIPIIYHFSGLFNHLPNERQSYCDASENEV